MGDWPWPAHDHVTWRTDPFWPWRTEGFVARCHGCTLAKATEEIEKELEDARERAEVRRVAALNAWRRERERQQHLRHESDVRRILDAQEAEVARAWQDTPREPSEASDPPRELDIRRLRAEQEAAAERAWQEPPPDPAQPGPYPERPRDESA